MFGKNNRDSLFAKEETYMKWTEPNHWIRKNFDYIFQNPIWKKDVPTHWSLCPYFWMSILVGLFALRLFLVPIMRLTIPLATGIFGGGDRLLFKLWKSTFKLIGANTEYSPGQAYTATFVSIFSMVGIYGIAWIMGEICGSSLIYGSKWESFGTIGCFVVVAAWCTIAIFKEVYKGSQCKFEWYGIFLTTVYFGTHAVLGRFYLWECVCMIGSNIWTFICWCSRGVLWFLIGSETSMLPPIVWGIIVIVIVLVSTSILDKMPQSKMEQIKSKPKPWTFTNDLLLRLQCMYFAQWRGNKLNDVLKEVNEDLIDLPIKTMFLREMLEDIIPAMKRPSDAFGKRTEEYYTMMVHVDGLKDCIRIDKDHKHWTNKAMYKRIIGNLDANEESSYNSLDKYFNLFDFYYALYRSIELRKEEVIEIANAYCKRNKEVINVAIKTYREKTNAEKRREELCKTCTQIASAPFKFGWALITYTWDVMKSKKQGFCPIIELKRAEDNTDTSKEKSA